MNAIRRVSDANLAAGHSAESVVTLTFEHNHYRTHTHIELQENREALVPTHSCARTLSQQMSIIKSRHLTRHAMSCPVRMSCRIVHMCCYVLSQPTCLATSMLYSCPVHLMSVLVIPCACTCACAGEVHVMCTCMCTCTSLHGKSCACLGLLELAFMDCLIHRLSQNTVNGRDGIPCLCAVNDQRRKCSENVRALQISHCRLTNADLTQRSRTLESSGDEHSVDFHNIPSRISEAAPVSAI